MSHSRSGGGRFTAQTDKDGQTKRKLKALLHVQLGIETKGNLKHAFPSKETSKPDATESDSSLPVRLAVAGLTGLQPAV
uniref:Uncharacterized protein n=2 Tax=Oryza sativa subsp. japonica TaxID=39947 RepID=Q7F178_ORYSJ|nr:hypothetical protein [Oryza sativa Japonica Group]BAC20019.1 hypothetical protein [Oryza sativa Japonica Group]BAC20091.1 hypothetical protein [Oryza sativa Japonica Group]